MGTTASHLLSQTSLWSQSLNISPVGPLCKQTNPLPHLLLVLVAINLKDFVPEMLNVPLVQATQNEILNGNVVIVLIEE